MIKVGDRVRYIGWDNPTLRGRIGTVLPTHIGGEDYEYRHSQHGVPVKFDYVEGLTTNPKHYTAWITNLEVIQELPNWEV